jgi:16S rRNA (guanine527-N7)-methyltransferase
MDPARIAELLTPFLGTRSDAPSHSNAAILSPCHSEPGRSPGEEPAFLSPALLERISTYIDILLRWNARINLTAIRDPEQIVTRHFGESLFAARHLFPGDAHVGTAAPGCPAERSSASSRVANTAESIAAVAAHSTSRVPSGDITEPAASAAPEPTTRLADLGSGAGFPGIPIKLYAPEISLTLVESNHKKSAFLREIARALTLTDINIQNIRAEALDPKLHHSFDIVTLRAVERFDQILPTAATLLASYARLALLIGASQLTQAEATLPALAWSDPIPIPGSQSRVVLLGDNSP